MADNQVDFKKNYRLEKVEDVVWMAREDDAVRVPDIDEKCTVENLQSFVDERLEGYKIVAAEVNDTGIIQAPANPFFAASMPGSPNPVPIEVGIEYCRVDVEHATPGGIEHILFLMPTVWNGRYMGNGGVGVNLDVIWDGLMWPGHTYEVLRTMMPTYALKSGFAVGVTDGAYTPNLTSLIWDPIDPETGRYNEEKLRNFDWRSNHWRNEVCKVLAEAITGQAPEFSYASGASGGGRGSVRQAQRCPEDFDGIWADNPFFPWQETASALVWMSVVMKDYDNLLTYNKLDAFREAVLKKYGGLKGWLRFKDRPEFDARECIGTKTVDGPITEIDAEVMNLMWDGPRRKNGTQIAIGPRPGACVWGKGEGELTYIELPDGTIQYGGFSFAAGVYARWVAHDPNWDWHTVTMENFEEWYDSWYDAFAKLDMLCDDTDLRRLQHSGTKFMITQATEDEHISIDNTIRYYNEVNRVTCKGDLNETRKFFRLFPVPGNDHMNGRTNDGIGPSLADGMMALMRWVEDGVAPDYLDAQHVCDRDTLEVDETGEIVVY